MLFGIILSENIPFMGKILFFVVLLCCSLSGLAQSPVPFIDDKEGDVYNNLAKSQIDYLSELYSKTIGTDDELINGRDYIPYYFRSKFKPLLFSDEAHSGSVTMSGRKYSNIKLKYDTYTDEIIYCDTARTYNYRLYEVSLNKESVDCFELYYYGDTLRFKHLRSGTFENLPEGFYEVVYDQKCQFLIRHSSIVHERNGIDEYFYTPAGYINVGGGYTKIKSLRQFSKLFGTESDDVKKFITKSGINIRKADKNQVLSVLKYYDSQAIPANK